MKKFLFAIISVIITTSAVSCSDLLEEQNYGNPTTEDMMNPENVILMVGQAYADIKWVHDHWGYWGVAALSSDECLCPIRLPGEHWSDGGYWKNLNTHNWNAFADAFKNIWNSTISGAILCNKLIDKLKERKNLFTEAEFDKYVSELEVLRSYYYYLLFDCFGRIPYLDTFTENTDQPLMEATEVWSRLVVCLEKNAMKMPVVTAANRAEYLGRVTQGFAYTLLARLYLNAESFGCTEANISITDEDCTNYGITKIASADDFYKNAIRCCDKVIESGSYGIEDDWFANFKIDNQNSKENIFVIVEDGNADFDLRYNGSMMNKLRMVSLSLHYCHQETWSLIEKPWNGFCARPTFIDRYNNWDVRGPGYEGNGTKDTKQWGWFIGPIYDAKGSTVLQDENKDEAVITKEIVLHEDAESSDPLAGATWSSGARLLKYEVDKTGANQWGENDFVLFRYADVLWMREEAAIHCGDARISGTNAEFQKMLKRTFAYSEDPEAAFKEAYGDIASWTEADILDERGREFAWENIRRRDLIRFKKFNDPNYIQYINQTKETRNCLPITYSVLEKSLRDENGNRIWTQNDGY